MTYSSFSTTTQLTEGDWIISINTTARKRLYIAIQLNGTLIKQKLNRIGYEALAHLSLGIPPDETTSAISR